MAVNTEYQPLFRSALNAVNKLQGELAQSDGKDFYMYFFLKFATIDRAITQLQELRVAKAEIGRKIEEEEKMRR